MKRTVDYAFSPCPNADAVADIQEYLGDRYDRVAAYLRTITDFGQFQLWCSFAGIEGFPVKAWFRHFHGEDAV